MKIEPSKVYVIGSLRNPAVPELSARLRAEGYEVFDDWYAAGPEADDYWQKYEQARGRSYREALDGHAANHVFDYDTYHLSTCDAAVLVLPAGKSGHLELGFVAGQDKPTFILMPQGEPERWDVMYRFADEVCYTTDDLVENLVDIVPVEKYADEEGE